MSAPEAISTALIVGASRGLGLGLAREYAARGWHVIGTVRDAKRTGLHDLADTAGGRIEIARVDITQPEQIHALREHLAGRGLKLLFVNAGVTNNSEELIGDVTTEEFVRVMITNALAPMRVVEALQDLVPPTGTIAVMSSGLGSVTNNEDGGWEVYRASKAALNTLMRSFAARHASDRRGLVLVAPGWVRTDMGGPHAHLDIDTSIRGVADTLAALSGRPGLRYVDYTGKTVRW